ncbi:LysE family translocator [Microbacterium sp. HD4P20]|uniref:LysE family translocator n=1 Tax=Microbacterium sp. HD4P20 TaxID=2864874 RepID=UPI001C63C08A|nr:LysE family translocator [Microbacterium sp. HD4P20]MCP2638285.1 LysE family translocator [Microbacterium sp. HD4P20]
MPSWDAVLAFSIASLILIVIPGPSVLFVIGRSLSLGRRGGLLSVLGNELGVLPLVVAVAFGVGAVVAESIVLFTIVKLLGAAYLIYLGVQAIRHRRIDVTTAGPVGRTRESAAKTIGQGFIVGITNPKTIVFFVAALPQFVNFHAGAIALQMIVLGTIFTLIAFVCDAIWALLAGTVRTWFASSPQRMSRLRATGGGMMIGLGGTLALTGNKA